MTARSLLPKGLAEVLAKAAVERQCEIVVERDGAIFKFRPSGSMKTVELDEAEIPTEEARKRDIVL